MRLLVVAIALIAASLLGGCSDDAPTPVKVTWQESEGHPGCVYAGGVVTARLIITGDAGKRHSAKVRVTAYSDENTSVPVGSSSKDVPLAGAMHAKVTLTIQVTKAPHVDEDGVAACRLAVAGV